MTPRGPVLLASDGTHDFANLIRRSPFVIAVDAAKTLQPYIRMMELAGGLDRRARPEAPPAVPGRHGQRHRALALHEAPKPFAPEDLARVDHF